MNYINSNINKILKLLTGVIYVNYTLYDIFNQIDNLTFTSGFFFF